MDTVTLYMGSKLDAEDIIEFSAEDKFGYSHVFLATGARWKQDGVAREHRNPIPGLEKIIVLTPDDVMEGVSASGSIVIFDDEHYYMGGVLAEKLRLEGHKLLLVTPAPDISNWTHHTMEQGRIQSRLLGLGVELATQQNLVSVNSKKVELACVFTDRRTRHKCDTLVLVTERLPNDELYNALQARQEELTEAGIKTLRCIGDCFAPGIIAASVHSGHLAAREFEDDIPDEVPFRRERVVV
jgi:dimethylamine/trimethylamine dehydrogenase